MDFTHIVAQSWRITWRRWELWLLMAASLIVIIPAILLAGGFGGLSALLMQPQSFPLPPELYRVRQLSPWAWLGLSLIAGLVLSATTSLSVLFQAGTSRVAVLAANNQSTSLGAVMAFSRRQLRRIIGLGAGFGLLTSLLAFLPLVIPLFLPAGNQRQLVMRFMQSIASPFSSVLGVVLLLLVIAAAIEGLLPHAKISARKVFRSGWWAFLLVAIINLLIGFAVALVFVPPMIILVLITLLLNRALWLVLPFFGVFALAFLFLSLAASVFSLVLYALVYQAAAQIASQQVGSSSPQPVQSTI